MREGFQVPRAYNTLGRKWEFLSKSKIDISNFSGHRIPGLSGKTCSSLCHIPPSLPPLSGEWGQILALGVHLYISLCHIPSPTTTTTLRGRRGADIRCRCTSVYLSVPYTIPHHHSQYRGRGDRSQM